MLEGKCPQCEFRYYGWALLNPRHQYCSRCGVGLEITDGYRVFTGYSPFTAESLFTNSHEDAPSALDEEDGKPGQKRGRS